LAEFLSTESETKSLGSERLETFKSYPFHPTLQSHEIHALSAKAGHMIYSAVIESDLSNILH